VSAIAWPEPAKNLNILPGARGLAHQRQGRPYIGFAGQNGINTALQPWWHYANHGERLAIECDRSPNGFSITAHLRLPDSIAENGDMSAVARILFSKKIAPQQRIDPQHVKIIGGNRLPFHALGFVAHPEVVSLDRVTRKELKWRARPFHRCREAKIP
jgi:hypothetical protein